MSTTTFLQEVEVLVFDVFGTIADWRTHVVKQLAEMGRKYAIESVDWNEFANDWRIGYLVNTNRISESGDGPTNTDELHRLILNDLIDPPDSRWAHLGPMWNDEERQNMTHFWHKLQGWPDAVEGLTELKKQCIVVALSNGNMQLLVEMAKFAQFPWDTVFSTELFDTYKPNPRPYQSVSKLLNVPPHKCAMVAAHIFDLRAAKGCGYKTIYVRRPGEDCELFKNGDVSLVKSRLEGGLEEVDFVVDSITELANVLKNS
ncbi:hypothetical protein APHAL10511_008401 [Amanita phalloides]|nr:hypothetical protein APHAL10511_008401 [Amanita phalloides]